MFGFIFDSSSSEPEKVMKTLSLTKQTFPWILHFEPNPHLPGSPTEQYSFDIILSKPDKTRFNTYSKTLNSPHIFPRDPV